jgi:ABC-type sugar transport system ATPase subunit
VRPEDVSLVGPGDGVLQGRVAVVEALGNATFVHVDTGLGQVNVEAEATVKAEVGSTVGLRLNAKKVHVFSADGSALPPVG